MAFQLMLTLFTSTLVIAYTVFYRPFKDPTLNKLEIVNEMTFIFCQYCCFYFTDYSPDTDLK